MKQGLYIDLEAHHQYCRSSGHVRRLRCYFLHWFFCPRFVVYSAASYDGPGGGKLPIHDLHWFVETGFPQSISSRSGQISQYTGAHINIYNNSIVSKGHRSRTEWATVLVCNGFLVLNLSIGFTFPGLFVVR